MCACACLCVRQVRKIGKDGKAYSKIGNSKEDFGEGITVFGPHVLQLTWKEKKAYLYDKETLNHEGGFEIDFEGWCVCRHRPKQLPSGGPRSTSGGFCATLPTGQFISHAPDICIALAVTSSQGSHAQ